MIKKLTEKTIKYMCSDETIKRDIFLTGLETKIVNKERAKYFISSWIQGCLVLFILVIIDIIQQVIGFFNPWISTLYLIPIYYFARPGFRKKEEKIHAD